MARPGNWWGTAALFAHDALEGVTARPIDPGDLGFLQGLYASTRADEMAATGWPPEQRRQFLDRQFELQHHYYQAHHAGADFLLLLREATPIGRLYWRESESVASLIDVALVPAERGRGLGSALVGVLVQRADQRGLAIELHVEPDNPALRLYRRFGFEVAADNGVYARMRREPRGVHGRFLGRVHRMSPARPSEGACTAVRSTEVSS